MPHATRPQHWVENLLLSFHNDLVSRNEDEFDEDRDGVVVMVLWRFYDVVLTLRSTVGVSGVMRAEALMSLPVTNGTTYSIRNENCPDPGAVFSNASFVPRIVHQTYTSKVLPNNFRRWRDECKKLNPCWEFKLWTDDDSLDLVKTSFPELLPTYEGYDIKIKRIDAARYMMLYKYGGVYMDMDVTCLRGFNKSTFRQPNTSYTAQQHASKAAKPFREQRVANAVMASSPRHPFLSAILQRLPETKDLKVLCATGPCFLTNTIDQEGQNTAIVEFLLKEMFSTSYYDKDGIVLCSVNKTACMDRYPGYLVSFWTHTWGAKDFDDGK